MYYDSPSFRYLTFCIHGDIKEDIIINFQTDFLNDFKSRIDISQLNDMPSVDAFFKTLLLEIQSCKSSTEVLILFNLIDLLIHREDSILFDDARVYYKIMFGTLISQQHDEDQKRLDEWKV